MQLNNTLALTTDDARPISSMMTEGESQNPQMADITLKLVTQMEDNCYCTNNDDLVSEYINCTQDCSDSQEKDRFRTKLQWWRMDTNAKNGNGRELKNEVIIISDKTGPESLSWLTGYGVIGLYLSVVLLCGRYTRAIFQYDGAYIMFHEYPNVDDMIQLCLGMLKLLHIYLLLC